MKKMGQGIKLPDEIKEKARVLLTEGYSVNYISKVLKISRNSVNKARDEKDNLDGLRQNKKEELIKKLWDIAKNALECITDKKIREKKMSAYSIMLTAAVSIDKAQLLSGGATEILGVKTEAEINKQLGELESAEKELKEAWKRATAKRKAEAEAKAKGGKS